MALSSNPVLSERWSTFYNNHGRGLPYKYPLANMEEGRNRLRTLREDWLKLLREVPAYSSDWPTTKTELDQLMVLLRWEPSKMWKIARDTEIITSAQDTTGRNARLYAGSSSEGPVTRSDQDVQGNPKRKLEDKAESHHTTSLRPNIFPFAYIRAFYNELDEASTISDELKAFAYEQSLKQIDIFYGRAANYCKRLQKALQDCRKKHMASKLYDAFDRDHQVLANSLNHEWIIAVNNKMKALGITVPKDIEDGLDENDEATNLDSAARPFEGSIETQLISTESNTTITENASQASSSSTAKLRSVRKSDDQMSHRFLCDNTSGSIRKNNENSEIWHNHLSESELHLRKKAYYRANHPGGNSSKDVESLFTPRQPPGVDVPNDVSQQDSRIADKAFSDFGLKNKVDRRINNPERVNQFAEDEESSLTHGNPPGNDPILTTPLRCDAKSLPKPLVKDGMQASANSKQSGQRRSHSNLAGAPSREETSSAKWPGLEVQPGDRSTYIDIEIRNSTSSSNNENHDSQRGVYRVPQDLHVQELCTAPDHSIQTRDDVRLGTGEIHVAENHEALRMGLSYDGVRGPSTSSYPTASLRRHPPNVSLSKETPARYAISPAQTPYEPKAEDESLKYPRPGYSRRLELERPTKSFSAADTIRKNVPPSTSNSNSRLLSMQQYPHDLDLPSMSARSNNSVSYAKRLQTGKLAGSKILQDPRVPHEKVTNGRNTERWPGYHMSDGHQGRQFSSTSTAAEPHDMTLDIDWQAVNQMMEHMIENIYAEDARNCAESYSQRAVAVADDQILISTEEGDTSSVSSDESDLTDSDEESDVCNPMDNSSILHSSVNIDSTAPYAEASRNANIVINSSSSGTRSGQKQSVSWGKAFIYRIDPEVLQERNRTTAQEIQPRSALKR